MKGLREQRGARQADPRFDGVRGELGGGRWGGGWRGLGGLELRGGGGVGAAGGEGGDAGVAETGVFCCSWGDGLVMCCVDSLSTGIERDRHTYERGRSLTSST